MSIEEIINGIEMLKIRFKQNAIIFINRKTGNKTKVVQRHVVAGDIYSVDKIQGLNQNMVKVFLPKSESVETFEVDKNIIDPIDGTPQTKRKHSGC